MNERRKKERYKKQKRETEKTFPLFYHCLTAPGLRGEGERREEGREAASAFFGFRDFLVSN